MHCFFFTFVLDNHTHIQFWAMSIWKWTSGISEESFGHGFQSCSSDPERIPAHQEAERYSQRIRLPSGWNSRERFRLRRQQLSEPLMGQSMSPRKEALWQRPKTVSTFDCDCDLGIPPASEWCQACIVENIWSQVGEILESQGLSVLFADNATGEHHVGGSYPDVIVQDGPSTDRKAR